MRAAIAGIALAMVVPTSLAQAGCPYITQDMVQESGLKAWADGSRTCLGQDRIMCKDGQWVANGPCHVTSLELPKHQACAKESTGDRAACDAIQPKSFKEFQAREKEKTTPSSSVPAPQGSSAPPAAPNPGASPQPDGSGPGYEPTAGLCSMLGTC